MPTRRNFLAGAAGVLAASALPFALADDATTQPAGRKLGWAIVGIGKLSSNEILPALFNCSKSRLVALVTGHPAKAPPILAKFGLKDSAVYSYENYDKLAENPDIDCIYIVLPNGMHAEYTIRGLQAGKHVLCEKPMANNSTECRTMIDASKATGKKLMIAYRVRREPYNMQAIEICKGNTPYGKPKLIITDHGFHIGQGAWRCNLKLAGGGSLLDVGIYGLNATRYLTGEEPTSVSAQLVENKSDPRFQEVEEGMVWTTKFPSGAMATCTTSYNCRGTNRCRILFDHGQLDMEPATGYHGIKMTGEYDSPDGGPRKQQTFQLPDIDQFVAQMDYFSDCVVNNTEPITTGQEGLTDMLIMEALYQSARTGQTVTLPAKA